LTLRTWVIALSFTAIASTGFCWFAQTHDEMANAIYDTLPSDLRGNIDRRIFVYGANEPDNTMYEPGNSKGYVHIDWATASSRTGMTESDLRAWSTEEYKRQNPGFKGHGDPGDIAKLKDEIEKELASPNKNWRKISLKMGQLSHHMTDLYQPYHAAESLQKQNPGHNEFEEYAKGALAGQISRPVNLQAEKDPWSIRTQSDSNIDSIAKDSPMSEDAKKSLVKYIANDAVSQVTSTLLAISQRAKAKEQAERNKDEDDVSNKLKDLIGESKDRLDQLEQRRKWGNQEAIRQHKQDHPEMYDRQDRSNTGKRCPHPKRCNFRWTDPQTGTRWCCPNNNGWDKECGHSFKGDAKKGCYWRYGCCEDD
jgi:hypothetical protein